jgi:hypothetical protein
VQAFSGPRSWATAAGHAGHLFNTTSVLKRLGDREWGLRPHARTTGPEERIGVRPVLTRCCRSPSGTD